MDTVYTIAFMNEMFLMVYNQKRNGWEMPGGHIENGEAEDIAAKREFLEESGYDVKLIEKTYAHGCWVFAGIVGERLADGEMDSLLFQALPDKLAFGREEYSGVVEWARSILKK